MKRLLKNCDILSGADLTLIKNGFLGVDGDTVCCLGNQRPKEAYDEEKDMGGALLIPGLVNCHTHSPMTLLRGVGSDLPLQQWLFDKVFPIEDRLTKEDIRAGSLLAILEMLSTGTTSFSDMYFEPWVTIEAVGEAGMKTNISRPVQSFDPSERPEDNEKIQESLALFEEYNGAFGGRVLVDFCVHAEYTCTERIVRAYADLCRGKGGRMHIHLSETKAEHEACKAKYGKTPARWFYDLGALDENAFAAHCVYLEESDDELFLEKGVSVVNNPTSNMKLGSGFAPIPRLLGKGINVALGTDGAASNNNLNLMEELHLASVIYNGYTGDPTVMKPVETFRMATINGAKLQGRRDTGELAVGKKADIVAISMDGPHMMPAFEPLSTLAYSAQGADVRMTMVDGKILYENGEFKTIDAERVRWDVRAALKRLYGEA